MSDQEGKKIPHVPETSSSSEASYAKAAREDASLAKGMSADEVRKKERQSLHLRNETLRKHFDHIVIGLMYFLSISWVILLIIWFIHVALPQGVRWLDKDDTEKLQWILTAGGFLAPIATRTLKRLDC